MAAAALAQSGLLLREIVEILQQHPREHEVLALSARQGNARLTRSIQRDGDTHNRRCVVRALVGVFHPLIIGFGFRVGNMGRVIGTGTLPRPTLGGMRPYAPRNLQIEPDPPHVLIKFGRPIEDLMLAWQDVYAVGDALEMASADAIGDETEILPWQEQNTEHIQFSVFQEKCVRLTFDRTATLRLHWSAAKFLAVKIKEKAQYLHFVEEKGVRLHEKADGSILPECFGLGRRTVFGPN